MLFDTCAECGSTDAGHIPLSDYFCVSAALDRTKQQLEECRDKLRIETKLLYEYKAKADSAEERGRRAGIEEHIRDLHAIENALDEFETDPPTALRVVGEHVGMALHNLRALAPRDSGKEGEADESRRIVRALSDRALRSAAMDAPDGPQCWCGKPSRHESGWCGTKDCELLSDEAEPLP